MQNEKVYSESAVSQLMVTSAACGKGLIQGYLQYNETKSRQWKLNVPHQTRKTIKKTLLICGQKSGNIFLV